MKDYCLPISQRQERNSALELLRIIAMFLIVLSHACYHSGFDYSAHAISFNKLFVQWGVLGNLGVDIYALISGYFLCKKTKSYRSIIRLLLQVWFYSYVIFIICKFGFHFSYSAKDYWRVFMPTIYKEYWFFSVYFVLCMFAPYVNEFLEKVDRSTFRKLIMTMFLLWVIIPTLTKQDMYSGHLMHLLFFYLIGAYFRLYPDYVIKNKKHIICLISFSFALLFFSTFVFDYFGESVAIFKNAGILFYSRESLLVVVCAVGLFAYFLNIPIFTNRFINIVSSCTFGVYLIHDNFAVRNVLWMRIFKHAEQFESDFLIVQIIASVVVVYVVSTLIEYLRIRIIGNWFEQAATFISKILEKHE